MQPMIDRANVTMIPRMENATKHFSKAPTVLKSVQLTSEKKTNK